MAITIRERPIALPLAEQLQIDPALLDRPEAQQARRRGLLRAKAEALRSAEGLVGWARPLLVAVLVVSFLHLWHQIAQIAPAGVPALPLPAWTHWLSAALLTISVDATALYLVATRSSAQYARLGGQGSAAVWFFYLLTAALNSLFVLSYAPGLPTQVQAITPILSLLGAILLGLLVPVSIAALERARQIADVARLSLLVEVETLRGLTQAPRGRAAASRPATDESSQNASPPLLDSSVQGTPPPAGDPLIGGRPQEFALDGLIAAFAPDGAPGHIFGPADVRAALGCSEGTAKRLLAAASERGQVARVSRGAYQILSATPVTTAEER